MPRERREGSVYQRESDKRWVATLLHPDRSPQLIYGKTKADAIRQRAETIREEQTRRVGAWGAKSVRDFLDHWLTDIKGKDGTEPVKPQTLANYSRELAHVLPYLGNVKLRALTASHIQDALVAMSRDGVSASIRKAVYARLNTAFAHAVNHDYIARNPMAPVKPPYAPSAESKPLAHAEMLRVLRAIHGDRYEALWYLLLRCGLRVSEARALTWSDIDEHARVIHVTKQIITLPGEQKVGPTKTKSSERDVPLSDDLLAVLYAHKRRIRETPAWRHPELCFPSLTGSYLHRSTISEHWATMLKRHKIPHVTIHGCRHTFATLAIEQGADMSTVQAIIGHARGNATLARYYLHTRDGRDRALMDRLSSEFQTDDDSE